MPVHRRHTEEVHRAAVMSQARWAVCVFFVLSGFVLYLPYARAIASGRDAPDGRRVCRPAGLLTSEARARLAIERNGGYDD